MPLGHCGILNRLFLWLSRSTIFFTSDVLWATNLRYALFSRCHKWYEHQIFLHILGLHPDILLVRLLANDDRSFNPSSKQTRFSRLDQRNYI